MLKATRSITISANSMINGTQTVYMSAKLETDGKVTSSTAIQNVDLYEANKDQCRADLAAFQQMVYDLEDQGAQENTPDQIEPEVPETDDTPEDVTEDNAE